MGSCVCSFAGLIYHLTAGITKYLLVSRNLESSLHHVLRFFTPIDLIW